MICFCIKQNIISTIPVCYRKMNYPYVLNNCKHIVCLDCMHTMYKNSDKCEWFNKCPMCRTDFAAIDYKNIDQISKNISTCDTLSSISRNIRKKTH